MLFDVVYGVGLVMALSILLLPLFFTPDYKKRYSNTKATLNKTIIIPLILILFSTLALGLIGQVAQKEVPKVAPSNVTVISPPMTKQTWLVLEVDPLLNGSISNFNLTHIKYELDYTSKLATKTEMLSAYSSGIPVFKKEATQTYCAKTRILDKVSYCDEEKYNLTSVRKDTISIVGERQPIYIPKVNGEWHIGNDSTIIKVTNVSVGIFNQTVFMNGVSPVSAPYMTSTGDMFLWTGEERSGSTAYDISNNSNHGTLTGNVYFNTTSTGCLHGGCYWINGTNDELTISNDSIGDIIVGQNVTMGFLYYGIDFDVDGGDLAGMVSSGGGGDEYFTGGDTGSWRSNIDNCVNLQSPDANKATLNKWSCIIYKYNTTHHTLYNGSDFIDTDTCSGELQAGNTYYILGDPFSNTKPNVLIDNIFISSKSWTQAEMDDFCNQKIYEQNATYGGIIVNATASNVVSDNSLLNFSWYSNEPANTNLSVSAWLYGDEGINVGLVGFWKGPDNDGIWTNLVEGIDNLDGTVPSTIVFDSASATARVNGSSGSMLYVNNPNPGIRLLDEDDAGNQPTALDFIQNFTICTYTNFTAESDIVSRRTTNPGTGYRFTYNFGLQRLIAIIYLTTTESTLSVSNTYSPNEWIPSCFGYNSTHTYLYMNGTLLDSEEVLNEFINETNTTTHFGLFGDGMINYVVAWNRSLNETEIANLHNKSKFFQGATERNYSNPALVTLSSNISHVEPFFYFEGNISAVPILFDFNISLSGGVEKPSTPTTIVCDGGNCNNTFFSPIDVNCSGSVDENDDEITYVIEVGNVTTVIVTNTTGLITQDTDGLFTDNITVTSEFIGAGEVATNAFDRDTSTKWLSLDPNATIYYHLNGSGSKRVWKYGITSANDAVNRDPNNWTLEGSNNGVSWTVIDEVTDHGTWPSRFQQINFSIDNADINSYTYYRLNITEHNGQDEYGDYLLQLSEISLYEQTFGGVIYDVIGNHTNGTVYSWSTSTVEHWENMRCRAIDLDGSNEYSAYVVFNTTFNIESENTPPDVPTLFWVNGTNKSSTFVGYNFSGNDLGGLDSWTYGTNDTGSWVNASFSKTFANSFNGSFYFNLTANNGSQVCFALYYNDSTNQFNNSVNQCLEIINSVPTFDDVAQSYMRGSSHSNPIYIDVNASDEDDHTITYIINDTSFLSIDAPSGIIIATPTVTDAANYSIKVNISDTQESSSLNIWVNITNAAPTLSSVSITPDPAVDANDLTCNPSGFSDADGDGEGYFFKWFKDGVEQSLDNASVLDAANTSTADDWYCIAISTDTAVNGTNATSQTVTIDSTTISPSVSWANATSITTGLNSTVLAPTLNHSTINISVNVTDADDEEWTFYACTTNQFSNGCVDSLYCNSSVANQSNRNLSCSFSASGYSGTTDYYIFVVDNVSKVSPAFKANFSVTTPPTGITLNETFPYYSSASDSSFLITATDAESNSLNFTVWNSTTTTYVLWNWSVQNISFNSQPEGNMTFYIIGIDEFNTNSTNSSIKTLVSDYTLPTMSIQQPDGAKTNRAVTATWTATDSYLGTCTYNVSSNTDFKSLLVENTEVPCTDTMDGFTLSSDGNYAFHLCAADLAGNQQCNTTYFSVTQTGGDDGGGGGDTSTPAVNLSLIQAAAAEAIGFCGDGTCDRDRGETAQSCSQDCGVFGNLQNVEIFQLLFGVVVVGIVWIVVRRKNETPRR